jgi:hypothetical protein
MDMQTLYEEMKRALDHFGLTFHDKSEVEVSAKKDSITFTYGKQSITIDLTE